MATISEMIAEIVSLRDRSEELSKMMAAGEKDLKASAGFIRSIAEGSASANEAAMALTAAAGDVNKAASSMISLKNKCSETINKLKQ